MPTWRPRLGADDDSRPEGLSKSTVDVFIQGWNTRLPPLKEPGRWQLALLTPPAAWALYRQHRPWLIAEARRRGRRMPWAERGLARAHHP